MASSLMAMSVEASSLDDSDVVCGVSLDPDSKTANQQNPVYECRHAECKAAVKTSKCHEFSPDF